MYCEIGGNFPLSNSDLLLTPKSSDVWGCNVFANTVYVNSGRSALKILLDQNYEGPKNVVIPVFICDTCIEPFVKRNYNIEYYAINKDLSVNRESLKRAIDGFDHNCIVYIHAYFGFDTLDGIKDDLCTLRNEPGITLVNDFTQSWLCKNQIQADYYVCSLRKWLQTPDGGILASDKDLTIDSNALLEYNKEQTEEYVNASLLKNRYLEDNASIEKKQFYSLFKKSVNHIEEPEVRKISPVSKMIYDNVDYEKVIQRRWRNARFLCENINNKKIEKVFENVPQGCAPFYYPVYLNGNRDDFQKYLIRHNIYCPIHWDVPVYVKDNSQANDIYTKEISLVCDQRYDADDMERLANVVNRY